MQRRHFIQNSAMAAMAMATLGVNTLAGRAGSVTYQFKPLRNNVGYFTEYGGTILWLNESDSFVVVDSQFPSAAPHVISELRSLGSKPFKYLLNTHHHFDHTSGNICFRGLAKNVVSHRNALVNMKKYAEKVNTEGAQLYPDLTFDKSWKAQVGKEEIAGYYYGRAHTDGDAIYHFQNANIVHIGDLSTNSLHPYMDQSDGASISNWITTLDSISKQIDKDTMVVMGHSLNPDRVIGNREDVLAFRGYLENLMSYVKNEIKKGLTKEDILKTITIPGAPDWKGDNISRALATAYSELM